MTVPTPIPVTTVRYAAPGELVRAALTDADLLVARAESFGYELQIIDVTASRIEVVRTLPAHVPGFMRAAVGESVRLRQVDEWAEDDGSGTWRGTWSVVAEGLPGEAGGSTRVEPGTDGSRHVVEGAVTVRVPLIGRKVESWLAERLGRAVEVEAPVTARWLDDRA